MQIKTEITVLNVKQSLVAVTNADIPDWLR